MSLIIKPLLAGFLGLVLFVPTAVSAPSAAGPIPGRGGAEIENLVRQIESLRGRGGGRLFRSLTAFGNVESFEALKRVSKSLHPQQLEAAFRACENYRGIVGMEDRVIEWLAEESVKGREPIRRAAVQGLVRFGPAAESELRTLISRSKDDIVRSRALGPLLPLLVEEGTPGALGAILQDAEVGLTAPRKKLLETVAAFVGDKNLKVCLSFLRDDQASPLVAEVVIEVIAEREERGVAKALIRALKSSEPAVQLAAMQALDRRGEISQESALRKLVNSDDEAVRRQAVISLGRLSGADGELPESLLKLAADRDPATRQGAAVALAELRTPEALKALTLLLADPDHIVRREALQQMGNLRRRDLLPALIARLNGERGRLKMDLATTLRLITGLDHGTSYQRWRNWWDAEGESFEMPDYETALRAERMRQRRDQEGRTVTSFYGLKVVSDRICFVLDISGSMESPSGRTTRVEVAKRQLLGVLERYPEGDLFNVIFFSSDAFPWSDELTRMTDKKRKDALDYVGRQSAGGATALYDALELAFQDRRIDTIFLLTDGVPSGGTIDDPGRIREEVRRWNATRHVRINCISVGGRSDLLKGLAKDGGGEYKEVR
jgi:HEAT repeat protein/Mg-chelatase subunit ChlD